LLANGLDLIANDVGESDLARNRLDHDERRGCIGSVELNVFDSAELIEKRLLPLNILDPIKLECVGHFVQDSLGRS